MLSLGAVRRHDLWLLRNTAKALRKRKKKSCLAARLEDEEPVL